MARCNLCQDRMPDDRMTHHIAVIHPDLHDADPIEERYDGRYVVADVTGEAPRASSWPLWVGTLIALALIAWVVIGAWNPG